jgi:hypothetical protein
MRTTAEPYPARLFSIDVSIALSPDQTFERLVANTATAHGRSLVARLSVILLTIAVVVPVMAVQRVTASLVATAAVSWSFVVAIQIAVALGVIVSSRARRIDLLHALDLWFAGHLPYSLWMLAVAALAASSRLVDPVFLFATALVPAAWTAWIVTAFCRTALGNSRSTARRRAAAHQAIVWVTALGYAALTSGGWYQVTGSVSRLLQ